MQQIGIAHSISPAALDESRHAEESPIVYVRRLASEKARAVALRLGDAPCIVAADTTVVLDDVVLNKPSNSDDAGRMLRSLANRSHQVHTGICVLFNWSEISHVETTDVTFGNITNAELNVYLSSGEPLDKAGAYGIQGYAARWVTRIQGDFYNVVGLPLYATLNLLRQVKAL